MTYPMAIQPQPHAPAPASAPVRIIQSAEMNGLSGQKAVFTSGGVVFLSLAPETTQEAQAINIALQKLGGQP